jgi:hypothetical protein
VLDEDPLAAVELVPVVALPAPTDEDPPTVVEPVPVVTLLENPTFEPVVDPSDPLVPAWPEPVPAPPEPGPPKGTRPPQADIAASKNIG